MRWLPLLLIVAFGGCVRPENMFVVEDPHHLVTDATLQLCGSETPLVREGNRLTLSRSVRCEGEGEIQLLYASGGTGYCHIGYVTSDAKQAFFRAGQSSCSTVA